MGSRLSQRNCQSGSRIVRKMVNSSCYSITNRKGQTFEGGIAGAPGNEAHGAYAFCALACLCILGEPHRMLNRLVMPRHRCEAPNKLTRSMSCSYMDMPLLISWLSARQYAPEGGFSGRTNKLVDGCYSHWVGGCWPLLQGALDGPRSFSASVSPQIGSLYSREGLIRWILCCCQSDNGGLRDKPGK